MNEITTELMNNIKHILHYDQKNAIETIVKSVFETILNLERKEFLESEASENNKANGYYERLARAINSYFRIKVPRDRLGEFKPVFLDAITRYDNQLMDLSFKLYTQGLTTLDIKRILKEVFGKQISQSSISNITKGFEVTRDSWLKRPLESEYYFIYIDALYISTRRDTVEKEAYYIAIGLRKDLRRDILGVFNIPVESAEGWRLVFKDLKSRGIKKTLMIIADGLTGLESVVKKEFPKSKLQTCLNHKIRRILLKARTGHKPELVSDFKSVFKLGDQNYKLSDAKKNLKDFITKWKAIYPHIQNKFHEEHIEHYFAYLNFPHSIHRLLYTTNWNERLNKAIRKTEKVRNSFPSPNSAMNLICAYLMDFEKNVYKYPITNFLGVQDELDHLLETVS